MEERRTNSLVLYATAFTLGIAVAVLIILGQLAFALLAALAPLLLFPICRAKHQNFIFLIFFTLSFPVSVSLLGMDAGTVTTFSIFGAAAVTASRALISQQSFSPRPIEKSLYLLVVLSSFSFAFVEPSNIMTAARYYYIFMSGVLLFLLVLNIPCGTEEEHRKIAERLMTALLLVGIFQTCMGLIVFKLPSLGALFEVLVYKGDPALGEEDWQSGVKRLSTLIAAPEATGEMLALLAPLVLYKLLAQNNKIYLAVFVLFAAAELLTATRSTIFLFAFASMATFFLYAKEINAHKSMAFLVILLSALSLILMIRPDILAGFLERFYKTQNTLESGDTFAYLLNRERVWTQAIANLKHLTPFGRGFLPPSLYLEDLGNFHSLYLTILYQLGWVGAPLFFGILFWFLFKMIFGYFSSRDPYARFLIGSCAVAMLLFLINQIKYEFHRHPPYQQFCWALLGLFYFIVIHKERIGKGALEPRTQ